MDWLTIEALSTLDRDDIQGEMEGLSIVDQMLGHLEQVTGRWNWEVTTPTDLESTFYGTYVAGDASVVLRIIPMGNFQTDPFEIPTLEAAASVAIHGDAPVMFATSDIQSDDLGDLIRQVSEQIAEGLRDVEKDLDEINHLLAFLED